MRRTSPLLPLTAPVALAALAAAVALAVGCGRGVREDPILRLSAEEALEQGKALLAQEKYSRAGPLLIHAFEVEPNSRSGREALLLAADALYLGGGTESYIKCEAKYRDFLNRFPTSERADYAQFQVANCQAERMEKPDRDQKVTLQALESYQELMRLYPASPYAAEARARIDDVTDRLAAHEMVVARFYRRFRVCAATIHRLEYLQEEYPSFSEMDHALFTVGLAYESCNRSEDAEAAYERLRQRYPGSPYLANLDKERSKIAKQRDKRLKQAARKRGRFQPAPPEDDGDGAAAQDAEGAGEGEDGVP
ncbi:MAG TPA: outer membrane protein assembly factor BamD [Thermoanaerobaculia bacterium]|jgi:outer membrane protein assembly factor BamD